MSTYIYLRCLSHDPPLTSSNESGQHLTDLPQLQADIANRDVLVKSWDLDMRPDSDGFGYRLGTIAFLAQHPRCSLGIIDEYGTEHPVTEKEENTENANE